MSLKAKLKRNGGGEAGPSTTTTQAPTSDSHAQHSSKQSQSTKPPQVFKIDLHRDYSVVYAIFKATHTQSAFQDIENAKRVLVKRNSKRKITESHLPYAQFDKTDTKLWVFGLCVDKDKVEGRELALMALQLDGLEIMCTNTFTYQDVFECSPQCPHSCGDIDALVSVTSPVNPLFSTSESLSTDSSPNIQVTTPFSTDESRQKKATSCCYPKQSRRIPFSFLLLALRDRVIEDLCGTYARANGILKFYDGFLFDASTHSQAWCSSWKQPMQSNFIHCRLSLGLFPSSLLVVPHFYPTELSPLMTSVSYPPGSPVVTLPYATPAYFVSRYPGPTTKLLKQFEEYLSTRDDDLKSYISDKIHSGHERETSFLNLWIVVRSNDGLDKGLSVIWPSKLCAFVSCTRQAHATLESYAYGRKRMSPTFDQLFATPYGQPTDTDKLFSPSGATASSPSVDMNACNDMDRINERRSNGEPAKCGPTLLRDPVAMLPYSDIFGTVASDSLQGEDGTDFRTMAVNVGSYVDSVAKERERERERLRRERESTSAQSPKLYNSAISSISGSGLNLSSVDQQSGDTYDIDMSVSGSSSLFPGLNDSFSMFQMDSTPLHTPQQTVGVHDVQQPYPSPPDDGFSILTRTTMQPFADPTMSAASGANYMLTPSSSSGVTYQSLQAVQPSISYDTPGFGDSWPNSSSFMMDLGSEMDVKLPSAAMDEKQDNLDPLNSESDFDALFNDEAVFSTDDVFSFFDQPESRPEPQINTQSLGTLDAQAMAQVVADHLDSNSQKHIAALIGGTAVHDSPVQGLTPWLEQMAQSSPTFVGRGRLVGASSATSPTSPQERPLLTPSGYETTSPQIAYPEDAKEQSMFDAIVFSKKQQVTNAKYTSGKFMIQDGSVVSPLDSDMATDRTGWHHLYKKLTDPQQRVIDQLTAAKYKSTRVSHVKLFGLLDDCFNDMDIDADDQDSVDEVWSDDDETKVSRPSSPDAPSVSIGTLLLASQFNHGLLSRLGTTFALAESGINTSNFASPLTNIAPTPISPGVAVTLTDEDTLHSSGPELSLLVREVMLNPLWASVLQSQVAYEGRDPGVVGAWHTSQVMQCISGVLQQHRIEAPKGANAIADDVAPVTVELQQPLITVGKSGALMNVKTSALKFWEKLGLSPRSGPKDVVAFMLHEDDRYARKYGLVWMRAVSERYKLKGYGTHRYGEDSGQTSLISFQLDQFQTVISTILSRVGSSTTTTLFYVVVQPSDLTACDPRQVQLLRAMSRVLSTYNEVNAAFHFVSQCSLSSTIEDDSFQRKSMDATADVIYNRILRPVPSTGAGRLYQSLKGVAFFQAPSITIACQASNQVTFAYQYPPPGAGVGHGKTILHVGYAISPSRGHIIASVVDQRGEEQDVTTWFSANGQGFQRVVTNVWSFAMQTVCRASIEWSVVVTKLGSLEEAELEAWVELFNAKLVDSSCVTQATLVSVDHEQPVQQENFGGQPGTVLSPKSKSIDALPSTRVFVTSPIHQLQTPTPRDYEVFSRSYVTDEPHFRVDMNVLLRPLLSSTMHSSPSQTNSENADVQYIHLFHTVKTSRSSCTKSISELQGQICQNFYELAVLARARSFMYKCPLLPVHLAVLRVVHSSLRLDELTILV